MSDLCPCGSGRAYTACCGPIISGDKPAPSAEALMRSRYSAYALHKIDHVMASCVHDDNIDEEATRRWSEQSTWKGLRILRVERGGPNDQDGLVEFVATYEQNGLAEEHHETARFVRQDGGWLYESGEVKTATVTRTAPKVGRNDPCPCGSGKKYKQCCGR
ncbi:MAG: YchJ family protein [Spirochaetales bacterium]|nr:YchJ family protein [Spirochaetales bacterium]MBP7263581.1 YchJ family protein [Spirochaetia bacterium]